MNTYRIDRTDWRYTPSSMASIIHSGNDYQKACRVFDDSKPGRDTWNTTDPAFGILFSVWHESNQSYRAISFKNSDGWVTKCAL